MESAMPDKLKFGAPDNIKDIAHIHQNRHQHVRITVCLTGHFKQLVVDPVKILFCLGLMTEHLDNLLSVHDLFHKALCLADCDLLL